MNKFIKSVMSGVLAVFVLGLLLAAFYPVIPTTVKAMEGRVAWVTAGTSYTIFGSTQENGDNDVTNIVSGVTNITDSTPLLLNARTSPGWRTSVIVYNPNASIVNLRLGNLYATGDVADIVIPAASTQQIDLGGGYNGPISCRYGATNQDATVIITELGN